MLNTNEIPICQDCKIQKLAEIVEHCRDLPKGSHSSAMLGMVKFGYLTHETALGILENHVRIFKGKPNGDKRASRLLRGVFNG